MVVRADSGISSVDPRDLKGMTYCLPIGYADVAQFEAAFKAGALKRQRVAGIENCLKMLHTHPVDFTWEDSFVLEDMIPGLVPDAASDFKILHPPVDTNPGHLLISKTRVDGHMLAEQFNLAFETLKKAGAIQEIYDRHFAPAP